MKVELLERMGTDLSVVNAFRVSYGRTRSAFNEETDIPLLNKHAAMGDKSPFYQAMVKFRITCPIFVARQLMRHHVGMAVNELSRRYTSRDISFDWPITADADYFEIQKEFDAVEATCRQAYDKLIELGVHREQARAVLPLALETQIIWTGSLFAWYNLFKERTSEHAQYETQQVARAIGESCSELFPHSWNALLLHE